MKNTARNNGNACPIGTVTQKIAYNMVFGGLFSRLIQPLSSLPFCHNDFCFIYFENGRMIYRPQSSDYLVQPGRSHTRM